MHKKYLSLALALMGVLPLRADLTVVIAVNGLDEAALKQMQPFWPQGGLRLLSEEAYQTTVTYDHWLYGGDEALATLLTGVNPSEHGIGSNLAFARETREVINLFHGDNRMAIGGIGGYSPACLLAPTVSDALRLQVGATAKIYAIGLEPTTTVLLAGHGANGCCWIAPSVKNDSLRWVSTSYYKEGLPNVADKQNMSGELSHTLGKVWSPRMETTAYLHPTAEERKHGFSYSLSSLKKASTSKNALLPPTSYLLPNFNTAVIHLALALQSDQQLGKTATKDVLLLQLTALTPKAQQASLATAEQEDMYLSLNQDLGFLMEQLQKRLGRDRLRVVVMGLPKLGADKERMREWNMPLQTLSMDRVTALTSTYLMALYGHERWIDGGYGHSLYLNRTLIEQKHLDLETIRRQVAEFLMEFDGIALACPVSEAYLHPDMAPSLHKRFVGDVVFELQSNYTLSNPSTPENALLPTTYYLSPIMIWSGARTPFPSSIKNATEVANYIL